MSKIKDFRAKEGIHRIHRGPIKFVEIKSVHSAVFVNNNLPPLEDHSC